MYKLILCFLLLSSLPLYAQESSDLSLGDEGVESNPVGNSLEDKENVKAATEENVPVVEAEPDSGMVPSSEEAFIAEEMKNDGEKAEAKPTDEEFVAPAITGDVKPDPVNKRPSPVFNLEHDVDEKPRFNPRKSHWLVTFGFENSKYEVIPYKQYEFIGEKKKFRNDQQELWGGRLGFGGEIYLGAGFITRSMVEGYYMGTLFSRILNGGEEVEDVEFSYTKRTGQVLGGDASQSLGWMFDLKTKNPFMDEWSYLVIEPFVEAGIGMGWAYQNINHSYDTTGSSGGTAERYKLRVRDDLLNARVGAGINMTSSTGFFLNLRATVNRYDVTKRDIDGFKRQSGVTTVFDENLKDAKIDPVTIFTLGGGYKF